MAAPVPARRNLDQHWGSNARDHCSHPRSLPFSAYLTDTTKSIDQQLQWNPIPTVLTLITLLGAITYTIMAGCHHFNIDPLDSYGTVNQWILDNQAILSPVVIGVASGMFVSYLAYKTHIRIRRGDTKDASWKNQPGLILGGGVRNPFLYCKHPVKALQYQLEANPVPTVLIGLAMCTAIYGGLSLLFPSWDPLEAIKAIEDNKEMLKNLSLGLASTILLSYLAYRTHERIWNNEDLLDFDDAYFTDPAYDFPLQP